MGAAEQEPIRVAVAVVEKDGFYLVGLRGTDVPLAGLAEFPGGKANCDEVLADAAVRECLEETGIAVETIGEYFSVQHRYEHGLLQIHFFRCRPLELPANPRPPFRWIAASELAGLHFPEANARLTELLLQRAGAQVVSCSASSTRIQKPL
jgi:mutator protein MutT